MTERDALMRSILDEPSDDAARLVFADWLDENGDDARAEFIRLQVALAAMDMFTPARHTLANRAAELRLLHEPVWRAELPEIDGVKWGDFRRGFVESATVTTAEQFIRVGGRLFERAPIVETWIRGMVTGALNIPRDLPPCAGLAKLETLDLDSARGAGIFELAALARSPHLARLRGLSLRFLGLLTMSAEVIARYATWRDLWRLMLSGNYIRDDGLAYLVRYGDWPNLRELHLAGNGLTGYGVSKLFDEAKWPRLEFVNFTGNRIGPTAFRSVTPAFRPRGMHLAYCELGDEGVTALAGSPWACELRELRLADNGIGPRGAAALIESPYLGKLASLHLRDNRVGPVADALRARFGPAVELSAW